MNKFDEVTRRTAERKARGENQTYPQHAKRSELARGSAPKSAPLPVLRAECPLQGDLLKECSTCGGPSEARRTYYCDHPQNDDGHCTRGNPQSGLWTCATCHHHPDAVAKVRPGDPLCGVAIGSYKWPALVGLQVRVIRSTCGPVPIFVSNDHPESAPALATICREYPDVTLDTNPQRIGHTGGDLSVFWKGAKWGAARGLSVVAKLSQRMIFTRSYWLQGGAAELLASGLPLAIRGCVGSPGFPLRTEAALLDVARWHRSDVLSQCAPGEYWTRREGGLCAEVAMHELVRDHLGGVYWPWGDVPAARKERSEHVVWHLSHSAAEYHALAARHGVTLPADFTCAGWEGELRKGEYRYG